MIKSIVKAVATPDRLSGWAADGFQKGINSSSEGTQTTIAKYATITNEVSEISKNISAFLTDGKIDDAEKAQVKEMLKPLFTKVMELV